MNEILNQYFDKGLLYKQVHPVLDLTIWNYTEKVQYESLWDEITLMCRGLVTNSNGDIVARPFKKFFNMEEGKYTPTSEFDVYDKMDGSLGILFFYGDEWVFATRGSFTSEQSIKGFEMLQKYDYDKLHKDYTYLFEIIYNDNRIVVSYDFEDLILLGMINTETGYEVDLYSNETDIRFKNLITNLGFKVVKKYDGIYDYSLLKGMIKDDEEGFVVRFSNGDRVKVKGEEYLRLHKIMTNISTTTVWEILSSGGKIEDLLKDVPDEFYDKIKTYASSLGYHWYQYYNQLGKSYDYFRYGKYGDKYPEPTKKEFAEFIKDKQPIVKAIMFAMWDGKDYDKIIWSALKPKFRKL
jgi:RNA ligase